MTSFVRIGGTFLSKTLRISKRLVISIIFIISTFLILQAKSSVGVKDYKGASIIKFESSPRFRIEVTNGSSAGKSDTRIRKMYELEQTVSPNSVNLAYSSMIFNFEMNPLTKHTT